MRILRGAVAGLSESRVASMAGDLGTVVHWSLTGFSDRQTYWCRDMGELVPHKRKVLNKLLVVEGFV